MSVSMTTDAVYRRAKTVTRRTGWWLDKRGRHLLSPGDRLTLCEKVQGRRAGEPLVRICEVEVVSVRRESLRTIDVEHSDYAAAEVAAEGFPGMHPSDFVTRFFVDAQGLARSTEVTRIEWRYLAAETRTPNAPSPTPDEFAGQARHG